MLRFFIYPLLILSLAMSQYGPASAQDTNPQDLETLTREQAAALANAKSLAAKAARVEAEISTVKTALRRSAAQSASYEKESREIDQRVGKLTREETRLSERFSADIAAQNQLLAALQRLSATPPPARLIRADNGADAARAAMIMADLKRQLQSRANGFTLQLSALADVRREIVYEQTKLVENEKALATKRGTMRALVASKVKAASALSENQKKAQKRAEALAAKAKDLRELIARFERAADDVVPRLKPKPGSAGPRIKPEGGSRAPEPLNLPDGTRFADARGQLRAPVQGVLKSTYGNGRKGLTVITRKNAQVTAPFTGRIEFAGAFKNYDNVIILNVGENYFMLLTGLGEIFVRSGEMVEVGEPVGLMPASASKPELYIELRKNGAPVNPKPWLGQAFVSTH